MFPPFAKLSGLILQHPRAVAAAFALVIVAALVGTSYVTMATGTGNVS